jgi:hypothetical protein
MFSLSSCGGIDISDAKLLIDDFFKAVVAEEYDRAETYLHPEISEDLKTYFDKSEETLSIDFQQGVEIEKYTGFRSSLYNSSVKGSLLELTMNAKADKKNIQIQITIVKNDNGYGIYTIYIS